MPDFRQNVGHPDSLYTKKVGTTLIYNENNELIQTTQW